MWKSRLVMIMLRAYFVFRKTSGRRWTSRPTLKALVCCFAVLRYLLPSCGRRPGWFGPGCSLGVSLSHPQYPTLLPRFDHRCHPCGGCGGHHPRHFTPSPPVWPPPPPELPPPRLRSPRSRLSPRRCLVARLPSSASFGVGRRTGSGASSRANLKALTKARVVACLICPKTKLLSRRVQTTPIERSSTLNDDRRSDVKKVVAAATTAPARSADNSTLGVLGDPLLCYPPTLHLG